MLKTRRFVNQIADVMIRDKQYTIHPSSFGYGKKIFVRVGPHVSFETEVCLCGHLSQKNKKKKNDKKDLMI